MRILLINTVPTERNGITNVIFNLHRAMDKGDICFDYVSINEPDAAYVRQIEEAGGRCYVLSRSMKGIIPYVAKLRKIIRSGGYDAVHAHGNSATLVLEMLAAKLGGCGVRIAHGHNTACLSPALHRLLNPLFQSCCTHPLACGQDAGRWLYGKREFAVVNNGIHTGHFGFRADARQALRSQWGLGQDVRLIGHVGAFIESKNQMFLVELLAELTKDHHLLLLGDGPLRPAVEARARALGLSDRVHFAGVTDRVGEHLSAFDLLVMPSLFEGLPLTLVEAQASGLACLVSDAITREADKTGNLRFLPLSEGTAVWAEAVRAGALPRERQRASEEAIEKIKACGYDAETESARLKDYYLRARER